MSHRLRTAYTYPCAVWSFMLLALLMAALAAARGAGAQDRPITLTVQLLTVEREPLPNVAVHVVDAATDQQLAEGATDQRGQARFTAMPPTEIRVRLTGQLANGRPLRHTRQDQRGIWVNLPGGDWIMDLRADTDGLVFPDLGLGNAGAPDAGAATAIAQGTLPTIYPTAPAATRLPRTVPRPMEVLHAPPPEPQTAGASAAPAATGPGLALLVLLLGAIGGMAWLMTRSRS